MYVRLMFRNIRIMSRIYSVYRARCLTSLHLFLHVLGALRFFYIIMHQNRHTTHEV